MCVNKVSDADKDSAMHSMPPCALLAFMIQPGGHGPVSLNIEILH